MPKKLKVNRLSQMFTPEQRAFILSSHKYIGTKEISKILSISKVQIDDYIKTIKEDNIKKLIKETFTEKKICDASKGKIKKSAKRRRSSPVKGIRPELDKKTVFKSKMEANTCRALIERGWKWEYEPKRFSFAKKVGNSSKVKSYLPDFLITKGKEKRWVEVKGRFFSGDKTRLKGFKRDFPEEFKNMLFVTKKYAKKEIEFAKQMGIEVWIYEDLCKEYKDKIKGWE